MAEGYTSPQFEAEQLGRWQACEQRIGYVFSDKRLLQAALTHASGAQHRLASNERLEFLGDAILGAVVSEVLFHRFPSALEGELTHIKSIVVSRQTCARVSQALGLEEFLILGKGLSTQGGIPESVLAAVFESLVAAVYLDGGLEAARQLILRHLGPEIEAAAEGELEANYKSLLQQLVQREHGITPTYEVLAEKGPDHCKYFQIAAQIGSTRYRPAWGRTKKEAEQLAARNALQELTGKQPDSTNGPTDPNSPAKSF
ncbi:MAG: ribonuclease III [Thermoguttaceae bacterium]|nr:ribonuclease III [Thermoguttaceae bacterium]MDW8038738.1 ribonuclease III [Thermoguttaceae bacterium]